MLDLVAENHPILGESMPMVTDPGALKALTQDMFLLMWSNGGIGLAAPQVGILQRMFVMGPQSGPHFVCVNPEITEFGPPLRAKEGCLTFPGLWLNISRPSWIMAKYQILNGDWIERKFEGLLARCYQHELDHLNGRLFTSQSSELGLKLARARQKIELRRISKRTKINNE